MSNGHFFALALLKHEPVTAGVHSITKAARLVYEQAAGFSKWLMYGLSSKARGPFFLQPTSSAHMHQLVFRFVGGVKVEVERVDKQLQLFSDTLDEWLACQKDWMYLKTIFSAPDIQRQLPHEAKAFTAVDKQFKDVMRRTRERSNALQAATAPGKHDNSDTITVAVVFKRVERGMRCSQRFVSKAEQFDYSSPPPSDIVRSGCSHNGSNDDGFGCRDCWSCW